MGSIPLPALAIQQQPGAVEQYGKVMQLKELMQRGQLQQGQIQLQQQQIKDQQATTAAAKNWDGQDFDALSKAVLKNGGSANAALAIQQHGLGIKKTVSDIASADATTGSKNLETFIGKHKAIGDALEGIEGVPDEQLHQKAVDTVNGMVQAGIFQPQEAQQFVQGIQNIQNPKDLRDKIDIFAKSSLGAKAVAEQQKTIAETATSKAKGQLDTAQLPGAQAESIIKQKQLAGMEGGAATGTDLASQEANSWLKQNPGKTLADYGKYKATLVPAFNFNLQQGGGSAAPLNDKQQATAQAILEGRMSPPGSFALKTPYWQNVMGEVFKQDPEWSEQRAQLRKDFTVGKHSTEINSINTAMGHVGALNDAIDALNNGNFPALNHIANIYNVQTGDTPVTTFKTIVNRVGPEIAKAYLGAGGSAGERGADAKDFDPALSPQQLKSNVGITAHLLRSKIAALENQWDQNKSEGMPQFQDRFIMPAAKQALDRLAPQGGGGQKFQVPAGAPAAPKEDGHTLKQNGKEVAVSKGGQWVAPASQ